MHTHKKTSTDFYTKAHSTLHKIRSFSLHMCEHIQAFISNKVEISFFRHFIKSSLSHYDVFITEEKQDF